MEMNYNFRFTWGSSELLIPLIQIFLRCIHLHHPIERKKMFLVEFNLN